MGEPPSETKVCPRCGTPQQWKKWRHCVCGFDFGPDPSLAPVPAEPADPATTETTTGMRVLSWILWILGGLCLILAIIYVGCSMMFRGL